MRIAFRHRLSSARLSRGQRRGPHGRSRRRAPDEWPSPRCAGPGAGRAHLGSRRPVRAFHADAARPGWPPRPRTARYGTGPMGRRGYGLAARRVAPPVNRGGISSTGSRPVTCYPHRLSSPGTQPSRIQCCGLQVSPRSWLTSFCGARICGLLALRIRCGVLRSTPPPCRGRSWLQVSR